MKTHIFYATREGQSAKIAKYLANSLSKQNIEVAVSDVKTFKTNPNLSSTDGAILIASLHIKKHEPEMVEFIKRNRDQLNKLPNAFLSVSMSQTTVEDPARPAALRQQAKNEIAQVLETFCKQTGWWPQTTVPVAGALLYTKYNFLIRWVMKRISRANAGPLDTSRDYEFTNWSKLDEFIAGFASTLKRKPAQSTTAAVA